MAIKIQKGDWVRVIDPGGDRIGEVVAVRDSGELFQLLRRLRLRRAGVAITVKVVR